MIRTAFALFVTTWALATALGYALAAVYRPVEAAAVAFLFGIAYSAGIGPLWRTLRRAMRP